LVKNGFLKSFKGRKGGVCLAKPAEEIRLIDIVAVIDTLTVFNHCVLGFSECSETNWCPVHEPWSKMRESIRSYFEQKSLADLAIESRRKLEERPDQHRQVLEKLPGRAPADQ
jgi:Rrf2 family protein